MNCKSKDVLFKKSSKVFVSKFFQINLKICEKAAVRISEQQQQYYNHHDSVVAHLQKGAALWCMAKEREGEACEWLCPSSAILSAFALCSPSLEPKLCTTGGRIFLTSHSHFSSLPPLLAPQPDVSKIQLLFCVIVSVCVCLIFQQRV